MVTLERGVEIAKDLGLTIYSHKFGTSSEKNLDGVHPRYADVARLAIMLCKFDGTIIPGGGLRTEAQAQDNVRRGTGILHSLHRRQSDGYGHAVDCIALTHGRIDWKHLDAFRAMAVAVGRASAILDVPIRQGCDWNMNGVFGESREWDWPHFEKPKARDLPAALALLADRRREMGLQEPPPKLLADCECPHCGKALTISVS